MPMEIVQGKSLEEIRQVWAEKLACSPEEVNIEVLDKPGFFSRQWKVKVIWDEPLPSQTNMPEEKFEIPQSIYECPVRYEDDRYIITIGEGVKMVIPHSEAGELKRNGIVQKAPFPVVAGEELEFYPNKSPGCRTWELELREKGLSCVGKINHKPGLRYGLPNPIKTSDRLFLSEHAKLEKIAPWGEVWDKNRLEDDLRKLGVVHGINPDVWEEILMVDGFKEIEIAKATMPIPPVMPIVEDVISKERKTDEKGRIDYFASKIQLVNEGDVIAWKIPGKPGIPGTDVLGRTLPAGIFKDIKFKAKKNVKVSDDGNQVIATVAGHPVKLDDYTYMVENVYALNKDVDLANGSIEFTGDVVINGNVHDSMHVYAGGRVEINGSVSHAQIRAEKGLKIANNVLGGKIVVGEKYVVRSEFVRRISELQSELLLCLQQTATLISSSSGSNIKPGQCLKIVIERQFPDLPKHAADTEAYFVKNKEDTVVTDQLMAAIRNVKHFVMGLGPLEMQALPFLNSATKEFAAFLDNMSIEVPEKLECFIGYGQGTTIECGGNFECFKGVYNSTIKAEGDVTIEGVCRGGTIYSGGNITIKELGGPGVSKTTVYMKGTKKLKASYCHPNVVIIVDKEIVTIDEPLKLLEVYRDKGILQVDKLKG